MSTVTTVHVHALVSGTVRGTMMLLTTSKDCDLIDVDKKQSI